MGSSDDLLTLKDAAGVSGRSVATLRKWISSGRLTATRASTATNSPVLIRRGDLTAAMQSSGLLDTPSPAHTVHTPAYASPTQLPTQPEHAASSGPDPRELLLSAVTAERDRLLQELDRERQYYRGELARVQTALDREQEHSRELERQVAALQRELVAAGSHGKGIMGYLKGLVGGK